AAYSVFSFALHCPATPPRSTLSLPAALPISVRRGRPATTVALIASHPCTYTCSCSCSTRTRCPTGKVAPYSYSTRTRCPTGKVRSEEHTSELQSREKLVCRLLLEKKKQKRNK